MLGAGLLRRARGDRHPSPRHRTPRGHRQPRSARRLPTLHLSWGFGVLVGLLRGRRGCPRDLSTTRSLRRRPALPDVWRPPRGGADRPAGPRLPLVHLRGTDADDGGPRGPLEWPCAGRGDRRAPRHLVTSCTVVRHSAVEPAGLRANLRRALLLRVSAGVLVGALATAGATGRDGSVSPAGGPGRMDRDRQRRHRDRLRSPAIHRERPERGPDPGVGAHAVHRARGRGTGSGARVRSCSSRSMAPPTPCPRSWGAVMAHRRAAG